MSIKPFITLFISCVFVLSNLYAQEDKELLKDLFTEDRSAVDAIVLYPEDVRNNIFEVSMYPELLIKLSGIQEKTKQSFRNTIAAFPQERQAQFYELTRYQGLTRDLAMDGKKSKSEITAILKNYPKDIHETALALGSEEYETLNKIYQLNRSTKEAFDQLINRYPATTQKATQELVNMPEVLTILIDNIDLTILVGDIYKNEPNWVQEKAAALNLEVARQQAAELEDYKTQLEEDPEAYQEMMEAAELYAKDNKVSETEYKKETETKVTVVHHYPYWYGYPYWYTYPYWTPVPYYYHTGFYIGPGGVVIIVGLPSYHYVHWHYTYYPHTHVHLHAHYHRHYNRHPNSHGGFHAAVNVNVNKNVNIRSNRKTGDRSDRPGKKNDGKSKMEIAKNKNQNHERFKTNDNHRGTWSGRGKSEGRVAKKGGGRN